MSLDLATIGLRFDTGGTDKGKDALDKLGAAADKASTSVDKLEEKLEDTGSTSKTVAPAVDKTAVAIDKTGVAAKTATTATEVLNRETRELASASQNAAAQQVRAASALTSVGMSAKATSAALRNVPAQFTDIVVSLQGGMNPLTVLLQQGGQLKDMFGGIVPAARALTGYIVGLINPYTLLAAGIAVTGAAYYSASKEQDTFARGLALSGNRIAATMDQLNEMSSGMAGSVGTRGRAAGAISAMIDAGATNSLADMARYAEVAAHAQRALGQEVGETAKQFAKLAEDPVRASEKLNGTLGQLTQAQYENVRALVEQGRTSDAARIAQEAYAAGLERATASVENSMGTLQRAARNVGDAFAWMWDKALNVGRPDTLNDKLKDIAARLDQARQLTGVGERLKSGGTGAIEDERAALLRNAVRQMDNVQDITRAAEANRAGIGATSAVLALREGQKGVGAINRELDEYRKKIAAIRAINPNSALLDPKQIAADEAFIRKKNTATVTKPGGSNNDPGFDQQKRIDNYVDSLDKQLEREQSLSHAQRARNEMTRLGNVGMEDAVKILGKARQLDAEDQKDAQAAATRRADEANRSYYDSLKARNEQLEAGVTSARHELEEMGLTTQELGRLRVARMDDAIAKAENAAAQARQNESDQAEIDLLERRVQLLGQQKNVLRETTGRTLGIEAAKADKEFANDLHKDVSQALSNAFRDSKNPARAFVDGLANVMYTRLSASLGNALADIFLGSGKAGAGSGLFGSLFGLLGGSPGTTDPIGGDFTLGSAGALGGLLSFGGPKALGGGVAARSMQEVNENGPETLSMGGKQYLMMGGRAGRVVPAAGGGVVQNNVVQVDARADRAQVEGLVNRAMSMNNARLSNAVRRREVYAT